MNHVNIASNCAQCHGAGKSFANMAPPALKLPPSNHVPIGTASCETCHAASNFTTFLIAKQEPADGSYGGLGCGLCHLPRPGDELGGQPATVLPPANHVPFGAAACESCHAPNTFTAFTFTNASGTAPPSMVHSAVSARPARAVMRRAQAGPVRQHQGASGTQGRWHGARGGR